MGRRVENEQLTIAAVGAIERETLELAVDAVDEHIPLTPRVDHRQFHTDGIPDSAQSTDDSDQYDAVELAKYVASETDGGRTLVVTNQDVSQGRRQSLFGIGIRYGRASLLSTFRLGENKFDDRVRKLAVSEVGYMLGLELCPNEQCPYRRADSVATLDAVDESPCEACQTKLAEAITSGDATTDSESAENRPTEKSVGQSDNGPQDRSTDELTHLLAGTARFWVSVLGYGVAFIVTLLVLIGLLEEVVGLAITDSDAATWVIVVITAAVAWVVYRNCRAVIKGLSRIVVESIR